MTIAIPTNTSTVKQLVTDLTSMDWKKNTDFTKLEKGDICFTTDIPEKPGVTFPCICVYGLGRRWQN